MLIWWAIFIGGGASTLGKSDNRLSRIHFIRGDSGLYHFLAAIHVIRNMYSTSGERNRAVGRG